MHSPDTSRSSRSSSRRATWDNSGRPGSQGTRRARAGCREGMWQRTVTGRVWTVGKASRHKSQRRQGIGQSRADFEKRRAYQAMLTGLQSMIDMFKAEEEQEEQARKVWYGGAEPRRTTLPQWREDSLGDRFFSARHITGAAARR